VSAQADEPLSAPIPNATAIVISDEPARSPYDDWADRGMRPLVDLQSQRDDIFPSQAALINAAYGGYAWRVEDHCRAGWPTCVRPHAMPSNSDHYCGYYVGGGLPCLGEGRYFAEGTWGWDYHGFCLHKHVALDWSHGRYQGGTGAYKTDGPKLRHH